MNAIRTIIMQTVTLSFKFNLFNSHNSYVVGQNQLHNYYVDGSIMFFEHTHNYYADWELVRSPSAQQYSIVLITIVRITLIQIICL